MLAVGIGARRSEFRRPCFWIWAFRVFQSYRCVRYFGSGYESEVGSTPHISNWRIPCDAGEPANVS